jgi:hypothetical protein
MKSLIAALAVVLALPAAAVARTDFRAPDQQAPLSSTSRLPAIGTDVAAPDQQAPRFLPRATVVRLPAPDSPSATGFDWADAAVGAVGAALLLTMSFGAALAVRRRQARHPSAIAG